MKWTYRLNPICWNSRFLWHFTMPSLLAIATDHSWSPAENKNKNTGDPLEAELRGFIVAGNCLAWEGWVWEPNVKLYWSWLSSQIVCGVAAGSRCLPSLVLLCLSTRVSQLRQFEDVWTSASQIPQPVLWLQLLKFPSQECGELKFTHLQTAQAEKRCFIPVRRPPH